MGISTSRLCDRRAYRGRIDGEYRMRAPSVASRSRSRGWRTATGPMPVMISRCGRWQWRTTRCWPVSVFRSACLARNSATSASTAWVSSARAPLRRISVRESVKAPGWASLITLLSDTAYHSFIGEVEALNTTTIRRLTTSRRHQLPAIALGATAIMVSNHGGRQLDGSRSPFDQLAEIIDAVGDKIDVICDGGISRGTHVLKALSLGAKACSGGRFYLYALAAAGQAGVERALQNLHNEIERDMKLMGCRSVSQLSRDNLRYR